MKYNNAAKILLDYEIDSYAPNFYARLRDRGLFDEEQTIKKLFSQMQYYKEHHIMFLAMQHYINEDECLHALSVIDCCDVVTWMGAEAWHLAIKAFYASHPDVLPRLLEKLAPDDDHVAWYLVHEVLYRYSFDDSPYGSDVLERLFYANRDYIRRSRCWRDMIDNRLGEDSIKRHEILSYDVKENCQCQYHVCDPMTVMEHAAASGQAKRLMLAILNGFHVPSNIISLTPECSQVISVYRAGVQPRNFALLCGPMLQSIIRTLCTVHTVLVSRAHHGGDITLYMPMEMWLTIISFLHNGMFSRVQCETLSGSREFIDTLLVLWNAVIRRR
jgi:hypothetical protein